MPKVRGPKRSHTRTGELMHTRICRCYFWGELHSEGIELLLDTQAPWQEW